MNSKMSWKIIGNESNSTHTHNINALSLECQPNLDRICCHDTLTPKCIWFITGHPSFFAAIFLISNFKFKYFNSDEHQDEGHLPKEIHVASQARQIFSVVRANCKERRKLIRFTFEMNDFENKCGMLHFSRRSNEFHADVRNIYL